VFILALLGVGLAGVGRGQAITEFAILSANAGAVAIAAGPDGNLWFTEESGNKIGRITAAEPPPPVAAASFFTLDPCRLLDTRRASALLAGPALNAGFTRGFALTGQCGIPPTAKAVSVNVTVTQSTAARDLRFSSSGNPIPPTFTINYGANQTRASNAIIQLGVDGDIVVHVDQLAGSVQLIVDVNGYFE
jgi:hypothetical protein